MLRQLLCILWSISECAESQEMAEGQLKEGTRRQWLRCMSKAYSDTYCCMYLEKHKTILLVLACVFCFGKHSFWTTNHFFMEYPHIRAPHWIKLIIKRNCRLIHAFVSTYTYICIRAALRSAENQKAEEHLFKHDRDIEDTTKLYLAAPRKLSPQRKTDTHLGII